MVAHMDDASEVGQTRVRLGETRSSGAGRCAAERWRSRSPDMQARPGTSLRVFRFVVVVDSESESSLVREGLVLVFKKWVGY